MKHAPTVLRIPELKGTTHNTIPDAGLTKWSLIQERHPCNAACAEMDRGGDMRILYTSNLYPPAIGGAQIHLHCLAQAMQMRGNEVAVVAHTGRHRTDWLRLSTICTESDKEFTFEGVPIWQIGLPLSTRIQLLPWALAYYAMIRTSTRRISSLVSQLLDIRLTRPELVHGSRNGREFLSRAALEFARKHDIPFVFTPNHHPRWKGYLYSEYDRIYREADALFVLTEAEKRIMIEEKGVREDSVHVTGVGPVLSSEYDAEAFRVRNKLLGRYVLYLGQQFRYKGIGALLEAAPLVWQNNPDVTFVFVGPQTNYSRQIFSGMNERRVLNLGEVDLETKTAALAGCEFLCLPSSQESFGGVFLEAWTLGKAVIGGRIPAIAELVSEGQDGLLSSQNVPELADAISILLASPDLCRRMAAAGSRKARARYTWEQIAVKTATVYQSLTGNSAVFPEEQRVEGVKSIS